MHIGWYNQHVQNCRFVFVTSCESHSGWPLSLLIYTRYNNNNNKPFALELSNNKCETKFSFVYIGTFGTYAKTICSISLKLTASNKDTLSYLHINFLRDWMSFEVIFTLNMTTCQFQSKLKDSTAEFARFASLLDLPELMNIW